MIFRVLVNRIKQVTLFIRNKWSQMPCTLHFLFLRHLLWCAFCVSRFFSHYILLGSVLFFPPFFLLFSYLYFIIAVSRYFFSKKKKTFNETKKKISTKFFASSSFCVHTFVFTQNPSQRLLPAIIKLEQILIDAGLCRKSFVERTLFGEKFQSPLWIRQKKKKKKTATTTTTKEKKWNCWN